MADLKLKPPMCTGRGARRGWTTGSPTSRSTIGARPRSEFEEQIGGDVGHWELEDMVAARAWLVEQGIADPERILLTGVIRRVPDAVGIGQAA